MGEIKTINAKEIKLTTSFKPLKEQLKNILEPYKTLVVTEETVKQSKADGTLLNKMAKDINNRKIVIKNEYTKDLKIFEDNCMDMVKDIKSTRETLLEGVEVFVQKQRDEKKLKVQTIIDEIVKQLELNEKYSQQVGILDKYLNASTTWKSIKEDVLNACKLLKESQDREVQNRVIVINQIASVNDMLDLGTPLTEDDFKRFLIDTSDIDTANAVSEINRVGKARKEAEKKAKEDAIKAEQARKEAEEIKVNVPVETKVESPTYSEPIKKRVNPLMSGINKTHVVQITDLDKDKLDELTYFLDVNNYIYTVGD